MAHFAGAYGVVNRLNLLLDMFPDGGVRAGVGWGITALPVGRKGVCIHHFDCFFGGFQHHLAVVFVGEKVGLDKGVFFRVARTQVQ